MKYSVLLPTRNGGPYLRTCIRSVLDQPRDDVELIVSDNANTDETADVLREFGSDPSLRTLRQDAVLPVAENWMRALEAANGDFLLMIGDDDYVVGGYFERMDAILARHPGADCVVYNAYAYQAPDSETNEPRSLFSDALFRFERDLASETELGAARRRRMVADIFRFRPRVPLNMQTLLFARRAVSRVRGPFFQPPFPDHQAIHALLLVAERWVFSPEKLVVVGVSPKSYGHYLRNHQPEAGARYLGVDMDFPGRLPGDELVNGIHVWLDALRRDYPDLLGRQDIDRAAYVRRQVLFWLTAYRGGALSAQDLTANLRRLSLGDWAGLAASFVDAASWSRLGRSLWRGPFAGGGGAARRMRPLASVQDIDSFARWITRNPETAT